MREHRWESQFPCDFEKFRMLCNSLKESGLNFRAENQDRACYIDDFRVNSLDEVKRLSPWIIDELTLMEVNHSWKGDFFLLAGRHHDLFREHKKMEAYLSISHLWRITLDRQIQFHDPDAAIWIGFRDTHGFIRVRILSTQVITPGESVSKDHFQSWMTERNSIFSNIISELELPIAVEREGHSISFFSTDSSALVSGSWPDAIGPCQIEFVITDRYSLLVPASRFVSKFGINSLPLRTFISGFSLHQLEQFHDLQPDSQLIYRGFIQAPIMDLPEIVSTIGPTGKGMVNLCDFQTKELLPSLTHADGVMAVIGEPGGFKIEVRLNRLPRSKTETGDWLESFFGSPMVYSPLPLF